MVREIHPGDAWKSDLTKGEAEEEGKSSLEQEEVAEEG
jgi:hypothetical protein